MDPQCWKFSTYLLSLLLFVGLTSSCDSNRFQYDLTPSTNTQSSGSTDSSGSAGDVVENNEQNVDGMAGVSADGGAVSVPGAGLGIADGGTPTAETVIETEPTVAEKISSWDLSSGILPAGVTLSSCEISGDKVMLSQASPSVYVSECSIDIDLSASDVASKQIYISAERINSLNKTDLTGFTSSDIHLYRHASKISGAWMSSAASAALGPSVETDSDGVLWFKIPKTGSLEQLVAVKAGESFDLSYALNVTNLTADATNTQSFTVSLAYYDKDFKRLTTLNPITNVTGNSTLIRQYSKNQTADYKKSHSVIMDCQDHKKYTAGEGTATTDESFNYCKSSAGVDLTNEDGNVYTESDIAYVNIIFSTNYQGNGYVLIKDIKYDPVNQIETEFLDAAGVVQDSSTDTNGFAFTAGTTPVKARLTLRTNNTAVSPSVSAVNLNNTPVTMTVGAKLNTFTLPRLGFTGGIPPLLDWVDLSASRTLCLDYFNNNTAVNCWNFLKDNGFGRWRTGVFTMFLDVALSGSSYTFGFHPESYSNKMEAETFLKRVVEADNAGLHLLFLVDNGNEGQYYWKTRSGRMGWVNLYNDATTGLLNSDYDPTPTDDTDDTAQTMVLMNLTAGYNVNEFNGTTSYTFSDGTSSMLPKVDYWEIGVETNISESTWVTSLDSTSHAELLTGLGNAVLAIDSNAKTQTSINPNGNAWYPRFFDEDYIEETVFKMNANAYTHFGFNMFFDGNETIPEDWIAAYDELANQTDFASWKDKTLSVGAYDVSYEKYDPLCNTAKWTRGFGAKSAAKLMARMLLTALSMNVEDLYDYTLFTSEGYYGANVKYDSCWRSDSAYQNGLFERVSGVGILDGVDEPSQFKLNDAGIAAFTIAKYVSTSSPYAVTVVGDDAYGAFLETSAGKKYLALWHAPKIAFATDDMLYVSGFKDEGSTQQMIVDLTLKSAGSFTSATRISLDGDANETLSVETSTEGVLVKNIKLDGDMPVLIQLE